MKKEQIEKYNSHATFLADIAAEILNSNANLFKINGVKEIIALYLLIPYLTHDTLETPHDLCKIPNIDGEFLDGIQIKDLRDTICHSFVTVEEHKNNGTRHGEYLIFDNRIVCNRTNHRKLGKHSQCYNIDINRINSRIKELIENIRKNIN